MVRNSMQMEAIFRAAGEAMAAIAKSPESRFGGASLRATPPSIRAAEAILGG
jgi:hypothetical protein